VLEEPRSDVWNTEDFFEMSLDNLCVAGLDGYFKRVNPAWTRTLGWTPGELMSRPSVEFVHPSDREATLAGRERLQVGTVMGPLVNRYLCKDGSFRWFEWRSIAHLDRGLVYAAARDITEQKLIEARLSEATLREQELHRQLTLADRMASIGTLAGGVAHEINNPLATVIANTALLGEMLSRGPAQPELSDLASEVSRAAERIRKIVGGLKTFSRADEERRAPTELHPLLELAADITLNQIQGRARLVKNYGDVPWVDADEARLAQVFINLLVNAARAVPIGSSEAHEIRIATHTDSAGRAVVEVQDTGVGIAASAIARVFEPFFAVYGPGAGNASSGLGLSICHSIVSSVGGEISVASETGAGSTFRVVLPGVAPERRHVVHLSDESHVAKGAKILVVDDEVAVGTALARALRDHRVTVVSAAKEAIFLLEAGQEFDVIFSDLMMPEMTGMAFYEELARRFPDTLARVVFVSGGVFTPHAHAFLDRVANERIEKPFDLLAVRSLVQRHVAAAESGVAVSFSAPGASEMVT
jgi:two-component system cell cycle sensor histidine kinase/response regulator CckA